MSVDQAEAQEIIQDMVCRYRTVVGHILQPALREGKVLYERSA